MVTFKVSDVELCEKFLPKIDSVNDSLYFQTKKSVEAAGSNSTGSFVRTWNRSPMNAFLGSLHASFSHHYPLTLSPDDFWVCIAQGFSLHISNNSEKYREQFVKHENKIVLEHKNNYIKGSPSNDWTKSFTWFSDKIEEHIGKKRDLVVSNFSTTGPIEKAVSEIVLMESVKNFFSYREMTLCGIPEITLLGTVEDWKAIKAKTQALSEFDLLWWIDKLIPCLDEIIHTFNGNVNQHFWKSFYKWNSDSGGPTITGWVKNLFPYFANKTKNLNDKNYGCGPTDFPMGLSLVPFIWNYSGALYNMEFLGGFVGVTQDENLNIRPALGWAVRDADEL